jgi:hypothetical protein
MDHGRGDYSFPDLGIRHHVLGGLPPHEPSPAIDVSAILPRPQPVSPTH